MAAEIVASIEDELARNRRRRETRLKHTCPVCGRERMPGQIRCGCKYVVAGAFYPKRKGQKRVR